MIIMKNMKKKIAAGLAGVWLLLTAMPVMPSCADEIIGIQSDYTDDGLWMYSDYGDGTVSVTCQDKTITEVEIPSEINGLQITMIEVDCFNGNTDLKSVTIPSTITVIDDYAFYKCESLETIVIPDSVEKIGFQAFYDCISLTEISIPAKVEEIEGWAFEGCNALEAVHVAKSNQNYMDDDGVLFDKNQTELFLYPSARTDTCYTLPDTCTILESYAFIGNSYLKEVDISNAQEVGADLFYYCTALESVTLPDNLEVLNGSVFGNCIALKEISLPAALTTIGSGCFYNCMALENVILPESVTSIESYAFFNCASMKSIHISEHVKTIGEYAFGFYYGSADSEAEEESLQRLPDFEIDADNGTEAFAYAAKYSIKCTGGITQGIVFLYIIIGVLVLAVLFIIGLLIMQHRYKKAHELR